MFRNYLQKSTFLFVHVEFDVEIILVLSIKQQIPSLANVSIEADKVIFLEDSRLVIASR